jgi:lysophospholipid acyltransferase (LPLAT)-like uncharacterized protein
MNSPRGKRQDSPHHQSFCLKTFLSPLGILYRLWTLSIRLSYKDEDGRAEIKSTTEPVTIILWHNRLFLAGEWHRRFRKKRRCYGLISGSRDGAWLEMFYGWAGIRAIRGSRNRWGSQATRGLIRLVKDGHDAGVTPDGSRGPKYQAKSGAVLIAKASRSPVALLSFSYSKAIRLKSWDEFVIPLPFSRVDVQTRVLPNVELFKDRDLEQATQRVEKLLSDLTDDTV